jgi:hypothetical protein
VLTARRIGEEGVQAHQRGQGNDRLRHRPYRAARDGIEHPDREFLRADDGRVRERAARRRAGRALDHLVDADGAPGPRVPRVDHDDLVTRAGTLGLVVEGCTTASGRIA